MPTRTRRGTTRTPSRRTREPARRPKSQGLTARSFTGLSKKRMASKGGSLVRSVLKQGETKPYQFLTKPAGMKEFFQHQWREDGQWWYVPCIADENGQGCPLCDDEDEVRAKQHYKFLANVYDLKEKKVLIFEGPKTLATQIFQKYQRKPGLFLKRVYDVTKMPTTPVTYNSELAEERPVRTSGLKLHDLQAYLDAEANRYFGEGGAGASTKSKKRRSALDDDEDFDEEDDEDFEDEDEFEDEEDDEYDDEEEDEEDDPSEDEMMDRDAWPISELKSYGREVGLKKQYPNRSALVRAIVKKRGY
jgi:hypothetical protein